MHRQDDRTWHFGAPLPSLCVCAFLWLLQTNREFLSSFSRASVVAARLSCLLSFDIITLDLWTEIAPHWMITIGEIDIPKYF